MKKPSRPPRTAPGVDQAQWQGGEYADRRLYKRPSDPRPGCRYQVQITSCDWDEKLLNKKPSMKLLVTKKRSVYAATEDAAQKAMDAYIADLQARFPEGVAISEGRTMTVEEIMDYYFDNDLHPRLGEKSQTVASYRSARNLIVATLGAMPESQLAPSIIEAALWEPRRKRAKEAIGLLRRALAFKNKDKKTYVNPCDGVRDVFERGWENKVQPHWKREKDVILPAQKTALYEAIDKIGDTLPGGVTQWKCFFFLMAVLGPRVDELLKAQITDYDRKEHTLWLASKTDAGKRWTVLDPQGPAVKLIEAQIKALRSRGYKGVWLFPSKCAANDRVTGRYAKRNFYENVFAPIMLKAKLATEALRGTPYRYDPERTRKEDAVEYDFTSHWFRHTAKTREELGLTVPGRADLPKGPTPTTLRDVQLGHENARAKFDETAVTLPYSHADNPIGFPVRRPYARRSEALEASYLPPVPDGKSEPKPERHLRAVPSAA